MTDSFEARGDFVPENSDSVSDITSDVETSLVPDFCDAPAEGSLAAVAPVPNGFVKLGLAPELLQAVADLGFTQPTAVQLATIPKAMQGLEAQAEGKKSQIHRPAGLQPNRQRQDRCFFCCPCCTPCSSRLKKPSVLSAPSLSV